MADSRILAGVTIVCLALVLIGSGYSESLTGAFFTDKEISQDNSFSVGTWPCSIMLYSGTNDIVEETGKNVTPVGTPDPRWSATGIILGATWIWNTSQVDDPLLDQTFTFNRTFYWFGPADTANLQIAADNLYWVSLNGNLIATSPHDHTFNDPQLINLTGSIVNGANILEIRVENVPNTADPQDNPAGLLYKLSISATSCEVTG